MPTATAEPKTKTVVTPFVVEADVPNNGDLLLQSILGCRLRSAIDPSRTVTDTATGREMIPKDPSRHLGMLPSVPGMRLHVNPAKLTYTITDPLHDDEEKCEAIRLAKAADSSRSRLLIRALGRAGEWLVRLGLRLRVRAESGSPATVVPIRECTGNPTDQGWCVCSQS